MGCLIFAVCCNLTVVFGCLLFVDMCDECFLLLCTTCYLVSNRWYLLSCFVFVVCWVLAVFVVTLLVGVCALTTAVADLFVV